MATPLSKPLFRSVDVPGQSIRGLVVGVHPAGFLSFREKGCRTTYRLPILTAYYFSVKNEKPAPKAGRRPRLRGLRRCG